MKFRRSSLAFLIALVPTLVWGQANNKLQIHFMDVGQGDGALLISPQGETVLFDVGVGTDCSCDRVKAYLQQLGITEIDYFIVSHYHADHIGCAVEVFQDFPLKKQAFDRSGFYPKPTYTNYTHAVGALRKSALEGSVLTLDQNSQHPVRIKFAALNGNGISTSNENDLSLVCIVSFDQFDAVMGGDLSGFNKLDYADIETSVAPKIGQVEVYKVNHHGSKYSSNPAWLNTIKPKLAIISCGMSTFVFAQSWHAAGMLSPTPWEIISNRLLNRLVNRASGKRLPSTSTCIHACAGDSLDWTSTEIFLVRIPSVPPHLIYNVHTNLQKSFGRVVGN